MDAHMPKQGRTFPGRFFPTLRSQRDLPPFWELEQLLREGFDRDSALAELARRREGWPDGRRLPMAIEPDMPGGLFTIMS
ncbi:hypothetical protein [Bosea sp. CS1GBMeth4]|uniref:hypothetical protein n=1 Tax=Bosea sp. CS1GBMeth4 TaxID=1892849 RepID=UPI001649107C|nr:hypothetical protein [Bosea sp. CS1GBMeth4]